MRCIVVVLGVCLLTGGAALSDTNSYGTFSHTWGANSLIVVNDPVGDQIGGSGRDITSIMWEYDHDYQYFRIDLAGPPMAVEGGWAESYGIYIDGIAGQGSAAGNAVVPVELSGIDWLFDFRGEAVNVAPGSVLDPNPHTSANRLYFREWSPTFNAFVQIRDFTNTPEDYFVQYSSTLDNYLQWRIPYGDLPRFYEFTGASHNRQLYGVADPVTYDITNTVATPEPGTLALLGLGMAGLAAYRRRKSA